MSYQRVPQDFMKGIFISPNNFSDPQNPKHGQYVNMQLKNDLYYSALDQISNIQFNSLSTQDEWIKIQQIKPCKGEDYSLWFSQSYKKRKGRIPKAHGDDYLNMISCQDWKVVLHKGQKRKQNIYRVKVLQTKTDFFRSIIFPPTFYKVMKDLYVN